MKSRQYKVGRDGVILGTYDEPEMVYLISCGKVVGSDDFWTDGMPSWAKVASRGNWTISVSSSSAVPPPAGKSTDLGEGVEPLYVVSGPLHPPSNYSTRSDSEGKVSFFSIWWKTALVIYFASAILGYLNAGEYGLGYALGGGLLLAPMSGLFFGGVIYFFSKK